MCNTYHTISTKKISTFVLGSMALISASIGPARAQQPELPQTIRIVAPFAPGGTSDLYARAVADKLGKRINRTVLVENKPGANGWIGTKLVAESPKDGSVLMSYSMSLLTNAATTPNAPVDVMKSLIPVAIISDMPLLVAASNKSGIRTPDQFLASARNANAKASELSYGTGGAGTTVHLVTELLGVQAKVKFSHIAYKGGSAANTDVAGGHIDFTMAAPGTLWPLIKGGHMNAVAVTSLQPVPEFPGVPTMASVVPGYDATVWTAIWAPAGTPSAIVQRLNSEINDIVKTKDFQDLLKADGGVALQLTPSQAIEKANQTFRTWKELATTKNIVVQP